MIFPWGVALCWSRSDLPVNGSIRKRKKKVGIGGRIIKVGMKVNKRKKERKKEREDKRGYKAISVQIYFLDACIETHTQPY